VTGPDPDAEARLPEARLDAVVLDTSALMAVLLGEPEGEACAAVLGSDARLLISGGTLAEALVVAGNRGIGAEMAALVGEGGVEVVPVTAATAARVAEAYAAGARATTRLVSTWATASPTRWPARRAAHCSMWGRTSPGRTCWPLSESSAAHRVTMVRSSSTHSRPIVAWWTL
jgi:ribonuclease VapC